MEESIAHILCIHGGDNSITSSDANYDDFVGSTEVVGGYSANGYGLFDVSGNAEEWCGDYWDANYYSVSSSSNPTGPPSGTNRVYRGGAYDSPSLMQRCANRDWDTPTANRTSRGFRVVK